MTAPVVVKVGGSLLTHRGEYREADSLGLKRLAVELAAAERPLVVVHGAGSFGHVLAARHRLHEGEAPPTPERLRAFAQVHQDVRDLNRIVLSALREAGFYPVAVAPLDVAHLSGGALDRLDLAPFERSLALGFTPVTFGDAVHDDRRGWGILSGDITAAELAERLSAHLLVHATDVEGVLTAPPGTAGAALLPRLDPDGAERLAAGGAGPAAGRADVTGGMASKLRSAARAARAGVPVLVLDGRAPGRLADALRGKDVPGTWIRAEGMS